MLKFELPSQFVEIIGRALGARPHDEVRGVIDEMQRQINAQQQQPAQPQPNIDAPAENKQAA